jgi:hypothetical protein
MQKLMKRMGGLGTKKMKKKGKGRGMMPPQMPPGFPGLN